MKLLPLFLCVCACTLLAQSYYVKGPANPKPHEATALRELTHYLGRRIDGKLVIGGKSPVTFQVGDTDLALSRKCGSRNLEDERWVIRSVGDQIIINGGGTRGALYAVYHFLEDCCGIHWWSNYEEYVPEESSLELEALDMTGKPAFIYRDIYWSPRSAQDCVTAVRVRLNRSGSTEIPAALGGSYNYGPPYHSHTFNLYIPPKKYAKEHPEYFALVNGKRMTGENSNGQLCLSNPALRKVFLENLLKFIEQGEQTAREQGVLPPMIYDISMNDTLIKCQCEKCKAEVARYNYSGVLLKLMNYLAAEVAKTHPKIYLSTLAFHSTELPPKGNSRAADNIIIKLSDSHGNQASSINDEDNKYIRNYLRGWNAVAKNIFIWDYAIIYNDLTGLPFASEFNYGDLFRYYYDNEVKGIFLEHESDAIADMYELKFFLETKLMENPYQDANALIDTFMKCYYGPAAPYVLKVRKEIDRLRKEKSGFVSMQPSLASFVFLFDDIVYLQSIYDDAEAAVQDDARLFARVRRSRLGLDRLTCMQDTKLISHGVLALERKKLDSKKAWARLDESWSSWVSKNANAKSYMDKIKNELDKLDYAIAPAPVSPELDGRSFYDFYALHLKLWDKENVILVDEPNAANGKAIRIDVPSNSNGYYNLPFEIGCYDENTQQWLESLSVDVIHEGDGYHWYKLDAPVTLPANGLIYITRSWNVQLKLVYPELEGKNFEIWVSAKFTGKQFHPEQTDDHEYIYIDRVALVVPKE